jgi:lactate permease
MGLSLVAILPIVLLVLIVLFLRQGLLFSVSVALLFLIVLSLFVWRVEPLVIVASAMKGTMVSLEIIAIIFGALLIFGIFKKLGGERSAKLIFDRISSNDRVKAVLVAWAFVCFLEGISGFGTPPMIVIPILVSIGFSPISSVIMSLVGDTLPVTFGAVGLPVTYGLASTVGEALALRSALLIATLNVLIAPLVVSAIMLIASGTKKNKFRDLRQNLSFIIFASLAVTVPSLITLKLFGPELPSIIGGLTGMFFIIVYALIQKKKETVIPDVAGKLTPFAPYIVVALLLSLTRITSIKVFLQRAVSVTWSSILGTGISYVLHPLALSATVFIAVATVFFLYLFLKKSGRQVASIIGDSFKKVIRPALALICVIIFVQIMLNSGVNGSGHASIIESVAGLFQSAGKTVTLIVSPFLGALGAFIAGSSTVSNLLFSSIQRAGALLSGNSEVLIVTMQGMGSAVGNVIGIHNILAALAVAGAGARAEKKVLRTNLPFLGIYLFLASILAFIAVKTGIVDFF